MAHTFGGVGQFVTKKGRREGKGSTKHYFKVRLLPPPVCSTHSMYILQVFDNNPLNVSYVLTIIPVQTIQFTWHSKGGDKIIYPYVCAQICIEIKYFKHKFL